MIGDPEKTGRYKGSDETSGRVTYPSLLGVAGSKKMAEQSVERALNALRDINGSADDDLRDLLLFILEREG